MSTARDSTGTPPFLHEVGPGLPPASPTCAWKDAEEDDDADRIDVAGPQHPEIESTYGARWPRIKGPTRVPARPPADRRLVVAAILSGVPRISVFYGIIISMRWREHGPPHFYAAYGEAEASLGIDPLTVLRSTLPPRQLGLVMEWAAQHQEELAADWSRAESREPLVPIPPLP
jgi:hypothetical protein